MRRFLWMAVFCLVAHTLWGQSFDFSDMPESFKGLIGETIKAPIHIKNNTDKPLTLIVRKQTAEIGGTQRNYFCFGGHCLDHKTDEYILRIEPGQTSSLLEVALEAGLVPGNSSIKYTATSKSNPSESLEFELHFAVEEKAEKTNIYSSRDIILYSVYPNPVEDFAYVDYKILNERIEAKLVLHNILGSPIENYPLSHTENKVKIKAETLNSGIYFYTLYLDSEGVVTRKLVVRK